MATRQTNYGAQVRTESAGKYRTNAGAAARLAACLKAVAEPTRLRILGLLADGPKEGFTVVALRDQIGLSQPTVSHHLRILNEAGLVKRKKAGVWAYYTLIPKAVVALGGHLTNVVATPSE